MFDVANPHAYVEPVPPPPSATIRAAAETLSEQINQGEFDGLSPEKRCELRELTVEMAFWADTVRELEWLLTPVRRRPEPLRARLRRWTRRWRRG